MGVLDGRRHQAGAGPIVELSIRDARDPLGLGCTIPLFAHDSSVITSMCFGRVGPIRGPVNGRWVPIRGTVRSSSENAPPMCHVARSDYRGSPVDDRERGRCGAFQCAHHARGADHDAGAGRSRASRSWCPPSAHAGTPELRVADVPRHQREPDPARRRTASTEPCRMSRIAERHSVRMASPSVCGTPPGPSRYDAHCFSWGENVGWTSGDVDDLETGLHGERRATVRTSWTVGSTASRWAPSGAAASSGSPSSSAPSG